MIRKLIAILLFTLSLYACGDLKEGPDKPGSDIYVLCDPFTGNTVLEQKFTDESRIGVWNSDGKNLPFRKSSADGASRLSFRGNSELKGTSYVCSPFDPDDAADGSVYGINTPDSYTWNGDGLCGDIPMFGSTKSNVVLLSPLCGVVDVPLVGGCRFRKLQFTSLERDKYVSGRYLVDTNDPEAVQNAVFEGRSRSVIVSRDEVIALNYGDTLHVYFPLPAQEYREYELAVETEDGEPVILQVTGDTLKVQRGRIVSAAPVKLKDIQPIHLFCFSAEANARIDADIPLKIDHSSHEISVRIEKYVGLNGIIPTFTLSEGCKAYVNGALQESGVSVQNFYHPVVYTIEDPEGLKTSYTVRVSHFTGLPCIFIETPDAQEITSRDEWMEGVSMRIDGIGEFDDYETPSDDPAFIKGRGNATWVKFPKKAFNMKLGKRATILGMPAHKRWCFIANYRDRTRMGNRLSYYIASHLSGLDWTPRTRFVELFYNGEHRGMYLLTEQIRIDPERVPVTEFEEDEEGNLLNVNEETVSGGYIFQLDNVYNEPFHFHTPYRNLPVEFKAPKENIPDIMYNYGLNLFNNLESLLYNGSYQEAYQIIDIDSFVDFWLIAELSGNQDAAAPRSDFMHKDRGGPLKAGPIWDYDAFTYWRRTGLRMKDALWYIYLFKDPTFCAKVKEHWAANKPFLETIPAYIDSQVEYIRASEKEDARLWTPMIGLDSIQGDEWWTFEEAIANMKEVYTIRLGLVDEFVNSL